MHAKQRIYALGGLVLVLNALVSDHLLGLAAADQPANLAADDNGSIRRLHTAWQKHTMETD